MSAQLVYRSLWRSTRVAFEGDANMLSAARAEVRKAFESNRHLKAGGEDTQAKLAHGSEVAAFLRENVVQGEAQEGDNYKLRIHKDTERGNNEDIKKNMGKTTLGSGKKCCSS
ncbi:hypothetical protein C7974DRAFT_44924 [Boeremia exigua]|uniref:uncharacterized protein n=1 Tax=Boeremia exigua TaxID=749465 RepID=UPI001E8E4380|nr:uncharacterized protein C7974DRAFT_44924 [Boeremia exigua]KAH6616441.1 hypothetical protein C7974DRAFT_44924 [Boeremia exigua]